MKNLSHFDIVKLADIERETHENCERLDHLLSTYLESWTHYIQAENATPTQLEAWVKLDKDRDKLLAFLEISRSH